MSLIIACNTYSFQSTNWNRIYFIHGYEIKFGFILSLIWEIICCLFANYKFAVMLQIKFISLFLWIECINLHILPFPFFFKPGLYHFECISNNVKLRQTQMELISASKCKYVKGNYYCILIYRNTLSDFFSLEMKISIFELPGNKCFLHYSASSNKLQ